MPAVARRDRGGEWWVDFRDRGRRVRRRSTIQTKRGAEAFERLLRNKCVEDAALGLDRVAAPVPTFGEFADRWMRDYVEGQNRPTTILEKQTILRLHLLPTFASRRLDEIRTADIDKLSRTRRDAGLSSKTINNILTVLRCALATAAEWRLIREIPRVHWQRRPRPSYRALSERELGQLIAAARPGQSRNLIEYLANTGCRFGEAAGLRWEDLDLGSPNPRVTVCRAAAKGLIGPTKTGRLRYIPLNAPAVHALAEQERRGELVFAASDGSVLRPDRTANDIRRAATRAGLKPFGWHVLRHTFASIGTDKGVPLRVLQDLLGHSTPNMTARYAHVSDDSLRRAVDLFSEPGSAPCWSPNGHQPGA